MESAGGGDTGAAAQDCDESCEAEGSPQSPTQESGLCAHRHAAAGPRSRLRNLHHGKGDLRNPYLFLKFLLSKLI